MIIIFDSSANFVSVLFIYAQVNTLVWDLSYEGWISVCHNDCMQILKV